MTTVNSNPDPHDLSPKDFEQLLTTGAGSCPHPDLVAAVHENVLPEDEAAPIREHLSHCELCALLLPDEEDELPAFSIAREARILDRMEATPSAPSEASHEVVSIAPQRTQRRPVIYAIAASFIVAALITGAHMYLSGAHNAAPVAQTPSSVSPAAQNAERQQALQELATLDPLPPPAPQTTDLIARGGESAATAQPTADELLPAFRAYNNRDYDAAIRIFAPLAARYPHAELPALYLGVSQLEKHQDAAAAQTLAPLTASPTASPDALWFAAVAAARSQNAASAASLFKRVCTAQPTGNRQEQACHLATLFQP